MSQQQTITIPSWPIIGAFAALGGMVVGSIGPWVTTPLVNVNGLDGGKDGWGVVVMAAIGAFVLVVGVMKQQAPAARWVLAGCGVIGAAICAFDWQDVESRRTGDLSNLIHVGWGLQIAAVSSGVLVVCALLAPVRHKAAATTPAVPDEI